MRINFFGDVCLHKIDPGEFSIDPGIVALAESAQCNVANLESPLTHATQRRPYKQIYLKAAPVENQVLDLFDVFSMANNHVLDYQAAGLRDTLEFLDKSGKKYFGVGANRRRSFEPLCIDLDGHSIAFLGCSQWHNATGSTPGATPRTLRILTRMIRRLVGDGFFVVVYPHWNYEYLDFPAPANRRFAQRLIDAGAHLVVGSHPHVVQGFEEYRGRHIFHSLGNFVFNSQRYAEKVPDDHRINETFVLTIELGKSHTYDFQISPVRTNKDGVTLLHGSDADRTRKRVEEISAVFLEDEQFKKSFYGQASGGARRISGELQNMVKQQGVMYLLSRLHRVTLQDLKIKLYSALNR